ncbi:transcriptional regulator [Domibacillus sp. DTU_2020_1001157_1_SI_ALB_TIR_016]|uniref:LexA family protein n=1 Tax=Domibacillus sp. DTU_2020_1001157_1_SI_ALB_TIR_016 TaxID=3077789 RepID=UPI0028EF2354|nr:transcriptional regulator [Domibacillus sp. DTU_2020_1001157_1_SI_ALB_TIR_016]WNS78692.1 transcriptional regulator [Domibacillus sp. DTU_2020_1001157_1_SI_ALB_TIR_016]
MLKQLSARQEKMLQFIDDYVSAKNYPPSIREIGDAVELKSSSTVKGHLDRLKASGYVTWEQGKPRTLNVVKRSAMIPMKLNA